MGALVHYVPPPSEIVITHDAGGIVSEYEYIVSKYIQEGRTIKITGLCSSACTLVLTSSKVCVGRQAIVAWHQAYDNETHHPRPDVTERMIEYLPAKLKTYLEGKIQPDYTPETTLYYDKLVSLGIPACDAPKAPEPAPLTTTVTYSTPVSHPLTLPSDKAEQWTKYWNFAVRQSESQYSGGKYARHCFKNGQCSLTVYYFDKQGNYTSAVEYRRKGEVIDRMVCRARDVDSSSMTCTGWNDEAVVHYEKDSTGNYVEARK